MTQAVGEPSKNSTLGYQASDFRVFALCFLAALVEGFDIQSAGVAAPKFGPAFDMTPSELGWVFSSNTFGLFLGAAFGGWISDRIGRRGVLVASMFLFGAFSIGTALAPTSAILIAMRFLTGVGLGGAMPNLIALTAEAGPDAGRVTRVTLITSGIPLGGALASLLVLIGAAELEWQAVFWVGGIAPLLVGALMAFLLPESRQFVAGKASPDSGRMSTPTALFGQRRLFMTLLLWTSFFFTLVVLYLMLNWLPVLLIGKGFERSEATLGTLLFAFGGGVGAIALGALMSTFGWRVIVAFSYVGMAVSLFAMASIGKDMTAMLLAAFSIGFFVIGAQYLLYGLSPVLYPGSVRGTGVGWAVAVGRLGSVAGPMIAAAILSSGLGSTEVILSMLPVILIAFIAAIALVWRPVLNIK